MNDPQLGFQGYSGRLGQWTFSKRKGRMIVRQVPTGRRTKTPAQAEVKLTFQSAAAYGRKVRDNPALRARYEPVAAVRNTSVYQVAVADYLRPPWIAKMILDGFTGMIGNPILIEANDDVEVMSVSVEIRSQDGTLLEQGPAVPQEDKWVYAATVAYPAGTPISITATAVDRPGNKGAKTITWN